MRQKFQFELILKKIQHFHYLFDIIEMHLGFPFYVGIYFYIRIFLYFPS